MASLGGLELLISKELEDEEFKQCLEDIHNFRLGVIRSLSKTDIEQIMVTGFGFKTKTLTGRREEIKQFILEHPSLMSQDVESLKRKFKVFGKIINKNAPRAMRVEEEEEYEEVEPVKPKKNTKKKAKAIELSYPKRTISPLSSYSSSD